MLDIHLFNVLTLDFKPLYVWEEVANIHHFKLRILHLHLLNQDFMMYHLLNQDYLGEKMNIQLIILHFHHLLVDIRGVLVEFPFITAHTSTWVWG